MAEINLVGSFGSPKQTHRIVSNLIQKGIISNDEAKQILKQSLDPAMAEEEKEKKAGSLVEELIDATKVK
jgi:polyhydroxyalkanoate synthesis regulator phasin